ncbi:VOC family protein [Actinoplanes sp. Pm04-4]|uniref:VOC family protein n=1 Tax=Paractinoplanes pyxinae TaxID=2997416 RepID=A0ABT4B5Y5_9ACTN|nr:VOC family protein [Actinoplanes pyxinae]MCY1141447.1 VOC family protein [Actinoplanes pyxinae]
MSLKPHAVTFDTADPEALATFWAAALGLEANSSEFPGFATIGTPGTFPFYVFQKLDDLGGGPNRFHIDFAAGDRLDEETERLVGLGATVIAEVAENGIRFNTLADPDGNKFDVSNE